ncbi:COMPASS-like H3K4 histone methylase component WDR5A (AtWDR5A) [Durusdinium trenchii]|uniref:COMPASS-like H3K4 histone methylase component WDR5A (AtWDR5A) n=1 Tax=Durusdinium trenchii TaxID=1381693 RepID=A0ABP0JNP5_9DINO
MGGDAIKTWVKGQELWSHSLHGISSLEHLVDCGLEADWDTDRLAACWSMAVHLWNLATGQLLWVFRHHLDDISGFCVNWEKQQSASWGEDGLLLLWDLETGKLLEKMPHQQAITETTCHWEGSLRCLSSSESVLWLWQDEGAGHRVGHMLTGHRDHICKAEACWDQDRALSWSDDATLRLWDLKALQCLLLLSGHVGPVWGAHVNWESAQVLSYSFAQKMLLLWNLQDGSKREISLEEEVKHSSTPAWNGGWNGGAEVDWESRRAVAWCLREAVLHAIDLRSAVPRPIFLRCCSQVSCAKLETSE